MSISFCDLMGSGQGGNSKPVSKFNDETASVDFQRIVVDFQQIVVGFARTYYWRRLPENFQIRLNDWRAPSRYRVVGCHLDPIETIVLRRKRRQAKRFALRKNLLRLRPVAWRLNGSSGSVECERIHVLGRTHKPEAPAGDRSRGCSKLPAGHYERL